MIPVMSLDRLLTVCSYIVYVFTMAGLSGDHLLVSSSIQVSLPTPCFFLSERLTESSM